MMLCQKGYGISRKYSGIILLFFNLSYWNLDSILSAIPTGYVGECVKIFPGYRAYGFCYIQQFYIFNTLYIYSVYILISY